MPLTGFTGKHPGCTIDVISEPVVDEGNDKIHPSLVLIQGLTPAELDGLLTRLAQAYDQIQTMERDDQRRLWMGRMRLRESVINKASRGSAAILHFQHRYGLPWSHLEAGIVHLRARINDPDSGELLAEEVRRDFAKAQVDAQVDVQEISSKDYSVWQKLVEHSIGLAS